MSTPDLSVLIFNIWVGTLHFSKAVHHGIDGFLKHIVNNRPVGKLLIPIDEESTLQLKSRKRATARSQLVK